MRKTLIGLLALSALGALWFARPRSVQLSDEALTHATRTAPELPAQELESAVGSRERANSAAREELGEVQSATAELDPTSSNAHALAEVRGRLLFPGGAPAAGVTLSLGGWPGDADRIRLHGLPEDWQPPDDTLTDADGRFRLSFDPPRAYRFALRATLVGHAEENWSWYEVAAGERLDVGQTTLSPTGAVLVRIVDDAGAALPSAGWRLHAQAAARDTDESKDRARGFADTPEADGRFRIEGLPAGPVELRADSLLTGWLESASIDIEAGSTVEAELRYGGPDLTRRIVVNTSSRPFHTMNNRLESVVLRGAGVLLAGVKKSEHSGRSYVFEDLDPGPYTLEITDRRFETWSRSGIEPGTALRARLVGNAALALEVTDEAASSSATRSSSAWARDGARRGSSPSGSSRTSRRRAACSRA